MAKGESLIGKRFGRLVVLEALPRERYSNGKFKSAKWRCKCDCGNEVVVSSKSLGSETTRSCGCLQYESRYKPPQKIKIKCPYPTFGCAESRRGLCCRECGKYESCENACLNSPERCGRDKRQK